MRYWLVGVTPDEYPGWQPEFIARARGGFTTYGSAPFPSTVYEVESPMEIYKLRQTHGEQYKGFFYVDDAMFEAAEHLGAKLKGLEHVDAPDHRIAKLNTVIKLPTLYSHDDETKAQS